jgi:WD40 repeat protein
VRIWSLRGRSFQELNGTFVERAVHTVIWSRDGSTIVTGGADRMIRYWNARNLNALFRLNAHDAPVAALVESN